MMGSGTSLENLDYEARAKIAEKLGVEMCELDKKIGELAGKRIIVHFKGDIPQVKDVKIIHMFEDLGMFSAECTAESLIELLRQDSVVKVEPSPTMKATGQAKMKTKKEC